MGRCQYLVGAMNQGYSLHCFGCACLVLWVWLLTWKEVLNSMTYILATHKETTDTRIFRVNPTYNVKQIWDGKKWENFGLFNWYYKVTAKVNIEIK